MNSLKALEELKFQVGNIIYYTRDLKETTFQVKDSGLFDILEKDLKVLEIIKNKKVDVSYLYLDLKQYNTNLPKKQQLTQDEYNLLKEVML